MTNRADLGANTGVPTGAPDMETRASGDPDGSVAPAAATDDPNPPGRDLRTGRFGKGNPFAVKTALRVGRANLPEVFAVLEARTRDFLRADLVDDGGPEDMPTRRRAQHEYRCSLHLQIMRLTAALELHGLFDRRGRLRALWLQRLESLMREARAFDASLGLNRRQKSTPSLAEVLDAD